MGFGEAFTRKRQAQDKPQQAPAVLPKASWVPFMRNSAFTARDEDLLGLANTLLMEENSPAGNRLAVITGLEGVGKSQLALEFCYRYGPRFERVHWLDCRHDTLIDTQVVLHGQAMHLPEWPEKGADQVEATLQAWQKPRQLIVLDHIPDSEHLPEWISGLEDSRILITSRNENWPAEQGIKTFPLGPLPTQTAIAVLREIAPRLQKVKDPEIERLAERLGGLPLALYLAGYYLKDRSSLSIKSYQADLEKTINNLPPTLQNWSQNSAASQPAALAAAFDLSIRQLDPLGKRIFLTARLCAPETAIPIDLLLIASGLLPTDQAILETGLEKVFNLGLLTWAEEGPSIQTTLAELPCAEASPYTNQPADNALTQFSKAAAEIEYPAYKAKPARRIYELIRHLQENAPRAEVAGLKTAGSLWNGLGYLLWVLGENDQAQPCFEKAIALDETNYGSADYRIVQECLHLGNVLYDLFDFKAARVNYQKALTIAEKAYAPNHPVIADCNSHLGRVLLEIGDVTGARTCFEYALAIHEKAYGFGPKHPEVAIDASNLGKVLESQGDFQQAKTCYERALEINESVFVYGHEHPQVAKDLANLGRVLRTLGDLQNARACYERVVSINEKIHGLEHAETASALRSFGRILRELDSFSEARECYERLLAIDEKINSSDDAKTAVDLHNQGLVLRAMHELIGAKRCFESALAIEEKIHYPEHPNIATNVHNLGRVMQDMGDLQGAKGCFERALAIDTKNYSPEHPYVATDVNNLGSILQDLKDLEGARRCFEQALAIDEKAYGEDHPNTARDINNLGSVLKAQGDLPGACSAFERALRIFEKAYGADHLKTRVVRDNLNGVLRRMG